LRSKASPLVASAVAMGGASGAVNSHMIEAAAENGQLTTNQVHQHNSCIRE